MGKIYHIPWQCISTQLFCQFLDALKIGKKLVHVQFPWKDQIWRIMFGRNGGQAFFGLRSVWYGNKSWILCQSEGNKVALLPWQWIYLRSERHRQHLNQLKYIHLNLLEYVQIFTFLVSWYVDLMNWSLRLNSQGRSLYQETRKVTIPGQLTYVQLNHLKYVPLMLKYIQLNQLKYIHLCSLESVEMYSQAGSDILRNQSWQFSSWKCRQFEQFIQMLNVNS